MYMFNATHHQYTQYKNQELAWLPSDTSWHYRDNLNTRYQELLDNNWIDKKFIYKFNSHGFRCEEFTNDDNIMFLGCSFTCGIGLPVEDTWAYIVAKNLNLKCNNLSIGGTGPDTAFRLANHYIPQLKPKIVMYLESPPGRFSMLLSNGKYQEFNAGHLDQIDQSLVKFYEQWILNDENIELHSIKHKLAIQALCYQNNIKFVFIKGKEYSTVDYARDLNHAGVNSNKQFAVKVLDKINQNN